MIILYAIFLISSLGRYLETDGAGAIVRPWFWIAWLFLGTLTSSVTAHLNMYFSAWVFVRVEALLTQLLFEHSLCIRLKAETSDSDSGSNEDSTKKNSKVMAGKINNLITSDLNNIDGGSDILELGTTAPFKLELS